MTFYMQKIQSPVGDLYLVANNEKLCGIIYESMWSHFEKKFKKIEEKNSSILTTTRQQLEEYFAGKRKTFDLPLELYGTDFQKKVWTTLTNINFGNVRSYKEQAFDLQAPKATRAVGRANGLNPISIVIPCHRVIGSNGSLTGYAGGLSAKKFLLSLESKNPAAIRFSKPLASH